MRVNYDGPNDGKVGRNISVFPEVPYGYMAWVNSDGDEFPGADPEWAYASGAGGHKTFWNYKFGIVFATAGARELPRTSNVPQILERHLRTK
jgi:hypothetical protein